MGKTLFLKFQATVAVCICLLSSWSSSLSFPHRYFSLFFMCARVRLGPRGRARTPRGGARGDNRKEEVENFAQRKNRRQTGDGDNLGGDKLGIPPCTLLLATLSYGAIGWWHWSFKVPPSISAKKACMKRKMRVLDTLRGRYAYVGPSQEL